MLLFTLAKLLCLLEIFGVPNDHVHRRMDLQEDSGGAKAGETTTLPPSPPLIWHPWSEEGLFSPPGTPEPGAGGSYLEGVGALGGGCVQLERLFESTSG